MSERLILSSQYGTGRLFVALIEGTSPLQTQWLQTVAYVDLGTGAVPDRLSLAQAWAAPDGVLVILGQPARNPGLLGQQIAGLGLEACDRMIWIVDPNLPVAEWTCSVFTMPLAQDGTSRVLDRAVDLPLTADRDGFLLHLHKGIQVDLEPNTDTLIWGHSGAFFGHGSARLPLSAPLSLTLSTPAGAAFAFGFDLPGQTDLVTWLDRLQLGFWYTHDQHPPQRFALFESHPQHGAFAVDARLVASRLVDPEHSGLRAAPKDSADRHLVSFLRTDLGHSVLLEVQGGGLGLCFSALGDARLALSPAGRFGLVVSDQVTGPKGTGMLGRSHRLACGRIGTETIDLGPAGRAPLYLDLQPGHPGHVSLDKQATCALTALSTTSWLRLHCPAHALSYQAQPADQGALFAAPDTQNAVPLMPYLPLVSADLPADGLGAFFPMVPLAGVAADQLDIALAFEAHGIAPARKAALQAQAPATRRLLPGTQDTDRFAAVTPRGWEAAFTRLGDGTDRWDSLQLARLIPDGTMSCGQLRLAGTTEDGLNDPLRAALLSAAQCLVISDPQSIRPWFSGDNARVTLRGWEFLLDPDHWGEKNTIMIMKHAPVPLQSLIETPGAWTEAQAFNLNPAATARQLRLIAQEARDRLQQTRDRRTRVLGTDPPPGAQDMDYFVNFVLDSPDWTGVVILNAALGQIPPDLAGIRAGIAPGGLYAHHLGVTQTPFTSLEDLQSQSSALFGLIRYSDTRPRQGDGLRYDFRVRDLGVLFQNSDLRDFRILVDLSIGQMFGQRSALAGGGGAMAQMEGVRHQRDAADAYSFVATEPVHLEFGNGPLRGLHLEQGEFTTDSIDPDPGGMTRSSFRFAGSLVFDLVQNGDAAFDVFSFDQLAFGDLAIQMAFANDAPQSPSYAFSIEETTLAESLSQARDGSLFTGFPIRLNRLVAGTGSLDAMGSMTVQPPQPPRRLPGTWYGLMLTLDMGNLSDAADTAGIDAQLLLAWGPAENQYQIGLNITGAGLAGSGNDLTLLGVLKLSTYALSLRHSQGAWLLMMHGMTLGAFGKTLPPNGSFDFYVFGNPDATSGPQSLGWYGAYLGDKDTPAPQQILSPPSGDRS